MKPLGVSLSPFPPLPPWDASPSQRGNKQSHKTYLWQLGYSFFIVKQSITVVSAVGNKNYTETVRILIETMLKKLSWSWSTKFTRGRGILGVRNSATWTVCVPLLKVTTTKLHQGQKFMCLEQRRPKTGFIVEMTAAIAFQRVTFNGTSLLGHCIQGKVWDPLREHWRKSFPKIIIYLTWTPAAGRILLKCKESDWVPDSWPAQGLGPSEVSHASSEARKQ